MNHMTKKFKPIKPLKFKLYKKAKTTTKKTKPKSSPQPISYLKIERHVQHIGKGGSFYRTHFTDLDGNKDCVDIPRECSSRESIKVLLRVGARLPRMGDDQKACFEEAVDDMGTQPTLKTTDCVGWNNLGGNPSFVYYDRTVGPAHGALELDEDSNRNAALGKKKGTLDGWRMGLEEACKHSDHAVFAISIAASGPLYEIIGKAESAIYHYQGAIMPPDATGVWKSSSGKTLTARCGQSMFGECSSIALFGFNMTELALEETCFSCNNLLVVLDEQGTAGEGGGPNMIDAKVLPYRIIGGQGRRRSKHYSISQGLPNRSWVVPVITTAEDELDQGKSKRKEGAQVRMVPIPFPPTKDGGTFISAASSEERNRLALEVETTLAANYGVGMPVFLGHLVKDRAVLAADILGIRDDFVKNVGATDNNWEKRYAEKFGMPLAGALLLVRYGIAPWTEERAITAITNLYKASRSLTVSVPQATDALLTRLRKLVAAKKHFPKVSKGETLTKAQKKEFWGCVREIGGEKNVTVVTMTRLRKLVQPAAVADQVLEELASRSLLVKATDGNSTRQVSIKGLTETRARYVCIKGLLAPSG
jgi:hypothetical protein